MVIDKPLFIYNPLFQTGGIIRPHRASNVAEFINPTFNGVSHSVVPMGGLIAPPPKKQGTIFDLLYILVKRLEIKCESSDNIF